MGGAPGHRERGKEEPRQSHLSARVSSTELASAWPPQSPASAHGPANCPSRSSQAFDSRTCSATFPARDSQGSESREGGNWGGKSGARGQGRLAALRGSGSCSEWEEGSSLGAGEQEVRLDSERARGGCRRRGDLSRGAGPPAPPGARATAPCGDGRTSSLAGGPRALGCPAPSYSAKTLTRFSLPTFLTLLCQLFAPGRNKALLSGCSRQFPEGVVTFSPSPQTPLEGGRGHSPSPGV